MPVNQIVFALTRVLYYLIFARFILSWLPIRQGGILGDLYEIIFSLTEPLLAPIRRLIPPIPMGGTYLDLAPLILILMLSYLPRFLL